MAYVFSFSRTERRIAWRKTIQLENGSLIIHNLRLYGELRRHLGEVFKKLARLIHPMLDSALADVV
jgi:hypothetical protein